MCAYCNSLLTIAHHSEADNITVWLSNENSYKSYIQNYTLHQHPHKCNKECVMQHNSDCLASNLQQE